MSRFGTDRFGREHARAQELAAARLAEPLAEADVDFLVSHLAWCAPCRAVAGEYEAQRVELRSMRLDAPVPPRDLWARTAAQLERERRTAPVRTGGTSNPAVRGRSPVPLSAISGLLVVALLVGSSMLGGRPLLPALPGEPSPTGVVATPFPVSASEIAVFRSLDDGSLELSSGRVEEVCPLDVAPGCASARVSDGRVLRLGTKTEVGSVLQSPTKSQMVVIGSGGGDASDGVFVVPIFEGQPGATPRPAPSGTPVPSDGPPPSDDPGTSEPPPTTEPTTSADPTAPPSDPAPPTAPPTAPPSEPAPTTDAPPEPTQPTAPTSSPDPITGETPAPSIAVSPQPDGIIEIASDVVIVGHVAGYAPDGSAFAFTARPSDGSHGPDVYLWRLGEPEALPITSDHTTVFADWVGPLLLISRVGGGSAAPGIGDVPVSVLVDPATGIQRVVPAAPMWRPSVDPTGRNAIWWDGSVALDPTGDSWRPRTGRLVLGEWRAPGATPDETDAGRSAPVDVLAAGPVADWQARWDETGTRLAVWIADDLGAAHGRLSLYAIDATTGRIDRGAVLLADAPAAPGFSIGSGRLAWSAPAEDGTSRVSVLAWSEGGAGQVELPPGDSKVVVVH